MNTSIKTLKDGRKVEVIGRAICIDGVREAAILTAIANHPQKKAILQALPGATHIAGHLVFTAEEAALAQSALDAAKAAYEASPEGIAKRLRSEREALVLRIGGYLDDAQYHGNRAWESGNATDGGFGIRAKYEAKAEAARAELAAFDKAHPEIVAAVKADAEARKAELEKHLWD